MLINSAYQAIRPALFALNAEKSHDLMLTALKIIGNFNLKSAYSLDSPVDVKKFMGLSFANGIGLAAGLDKDGEVIDGLASLGFGFLEVGTVTPRPQKGNPYPRLFRLSASQAIINRMGFNNKGVDNLVKNVKKSRYFQKRSGILGINIGKNADTPIENAVDDYLFCLEKIYQFADYVAINISSPNTKNLRQLQDASELSNLLINIKNTQLRLSDVHKRYVPIALKISPDINDEQIKTIADLLIKFKMDCVIASNTTITRNNLEDNGLLAGETGGLSGMPLLTLSNLLLTKLKTALGDELPIIGVGGIINGKNAKDKSNCGADLLQLYTGLIYKGPALIKECIEALR